MEFAGKLLSVAAGGALGAASRYLLNISPLADLFGKFPFPTFVINVAGSFLIGFFMILFADKWVVSEGLRLTVIVGFLGAFTTFSTFEVEIVGLMQERHFVTAFIYLALSVIVGFVGVLAGIALARQL